MRSNPFGSAGTLVAPVATPTTSTAQIGTGDSTAHVVATATSAEVKLTANQPRLATSAADVDGPRCLDVVKTPHLGYPVMAAKSAGNRLAHTPSMNNLLQPSHEQGQTIHLSRMRGGGSVNGRGRSPKDRSDPMSTAAQF